MLRTRTHLTTPPGGSPVTEPGDRGAWELYSGGFSLPAEPKVPLRHRRLVIAFATVSVLLLVGWLVFSLVTSGQDFDPSLDPDLIPGEQDFDPTVPGSDAG